MSTFHMLHTLCLYSLPLLLFNTRYHKCPKSFSTLDFLYFAVQIRGCAPRRGYSGKMIWRRFHMCAWVTLCCVAAVSECVAPQQAAEGSTDPADDPTGVGPSQKKPDEMPPCPPAPSMPDEGPEPLGSNEMVVVPICDQGVQCYGPSIADEPSTSTAHPGTEISAVQQAPESNEEIRQASDPVPSGLRLGPPQASAKDIPPAWFKLKNNPLVDPGERHRPHIELIDCLVQA